MTERIHWQFSDEELALIQSKHQDKQLYYAVQLKYYEKHLTFCSDTAVLSRKTLAMVAKLLGVSIKLHPPLSSRTLSRYYQEIRQYYESKQIQIQHRHFVKTWLIETVFPQEYLTVEQLKEKVLDFLKRHKIESFAPSALERLIKSTSHQYERHLFQTIYQQLNHKTKAHLDKLLLMKDQASVFSWIKRWPNGLSLESILDEAEKLKCLQTMCLPDVLAKIPNKRLHYYDRYIKTLYSNIIREMPKIRRYALLAIFSWKQRQIISDRMVELLIKLIHRFVKSGENKLKKELSLVTNIKKNCSAKQLLQELIITIITHEDEVVKEGIYPIIPKERLLSALQNQKDVHLYDTLVQERARQSFAHHYRRMLAPVLELLHFDTHNANNQALLDGLRFIQSYLDSGCQYYPQTEDVPIIGAIKKSHLGFVQDSASTGHRINRLNYEMCLLRNLRGKLRTKEIWIHNGYRYRNPEKDLPQDFDENRTYYYDLLGKPLDVNRFILKLKRQLYKALKKFNKDIKRQKYVKILKKPLGHIKITPLKKQPLPQNLEIIKKEVFARWPNTSLLDALKETDLFVNFIEPFQSSGMKEAIAKQELKKRILLAILGCGTNTGLKSVSAGNAAVSYSDLAYVKQRYLDPDNLRQAIRSIVNQLLQIRSQEIWDYCTTAVASDSTLFPASDQNLMSQWHPRYHKKGVMVYWHVDTKAICIYSQLKTCASSEVAAMIEGVLRHCTDMNIEKNYVDTHGASVVGFAFSYMLDFLLYPRFNNIHIQRLYTVKKADRQNYPHIADIIAGSIRWDRIKAQYDAIVQYTAALKLGTADAETIMKRFTRDNERHPVYKALCELGKVIKTIFLCRYLSSEALRREIHEGLNVVERWNGVNDFIFYGRSETLRHRNPLELEISVLCLHLLQLSMVYINTLMLQQIIQESDWLPKMTVEDKRAISPLLHEHINPYGLFLINMDERLAVKHPPLRAA